MFTIDLDLKVCRREPEAGMKCLVVLVVIYSPSFSEERVCFLGEVVVGIAELAREKIH